MTERLTDWLLGL